MQRAAEINVPVINVPGWYDVDDEQTLQLLKAELAGERLPFAEPGLKGADAPATRQFLAAPARATGGRGVVVIAAQTSRSLPVHRRGQSSLLALGGLGLLMMAFVAAAPWIIAHLRLCRLRPGDRSLGRHHHRRRQRSRPPCRSERGLIVIVAWRSPCGCWSSAEEPLLSTDIYRYVWDGRVQAAGINPYPLCRPTSARSPCATPRSIPTSIARTMPSLPIRRWRRCSSSP